VTPSLPDNHTKTDPQKRADANRQSSSWDINNALENYSTLVVAQFIFALSSFGCVWLIARHLGSEQYGGIVAILAASQTLQVLINWTSTALVRFGIEEFVTTGLISKTFWGRLYIVAPNLVLVFGITVIWFTPISNWFKLPDSAWLLVIANVVAGVFWLHLQYSFQSLKFPKIQAVLTATERISLLILISTLLLAGSLSIESVIICYTITPLVMCLVGAFLIRTRISRPVAFDLGTAKKILTFSLPLVPYSVITYFFTSSLDAIFILHFLTKYDLAVYAIAAQIMGMMLHVLILANTLLLPMFVTMEANNEGERLENYFLNILPLATIAWGAICLPAGFLGQAMLPYVFGNEFELIRVPFWLLVTAVSFGAPSYLGYAAMATSRLLTHVSLYSSLCSAITNILLNLLLIPKYGLVGCAWATAAAHFVSVITFALFLKMKTSIKVSWVPFALLPTIVQLVVLSFSGSIVLAAATWVCSSLLVLIIFRSSVRTGLRTLMNYL